VVNNQVYVCGGFNGSLRVRTVDVYDPVKDVWCTVQPMEARRSTLGAAVLDGMLYAVGGFDGSTGLCPFLRFSSIQEFFRTTFLTDLKVYAFN